MVEARLDKAEKNIAEALHSNDSRRGFGCVGERSAQIDVEQSPATRPSPPEGIMRSRKGRLFDRRRGMEEKLRRSLIVARQFAHDEHDEQLAKLLRDK
jgi:hypothetical protein